MPGPAVLATLMRRLRLAHKQRIHRRHLARRIGYEAWCERYDRLDEALRERLAGAEASGPTIDLRLPLAGAPEALQASVASMRAQWFPHWRLWLAGDAPPAVAAWAAAHVAGDARIRLGEPGGEAAWLADVEPGERWREHALALFAALLRARPSLGLVYADHDQLDTQGRRHDPCFKPDWNPDLLLAADWIGTPVVWRAGLRPEVATSAHERLLIAAERLGPAQVHHIPQLLVHRPPHGAPASSDAAAVAAHLARRGEAATAEPGAHGVRVRFALPQPAPRVSVVIPTRNGLDLLRTCVDSLRRLTRYPDYEIVVVDNGSDDPACLRWLARAEAAGHLRVRRDPRSPFNFAALNNDALADCTGSVLALVNNDIEVIEPGWLEEMVSLALRPGVGAVGARLLYGDRSVQHAGIVGGILGGSGHGHRRVAPGDAGPMQRVLRLQQLSAVTAACLVVQRRHYEAVGGMDAEAFPVTFNDTDFCLRLNAAGQRTLYTPHAVLMHHESVSRGSDKDGSRRARFEAAREAFAARWPGFVAADPAYNPNLTLAAEHFGLAEPPRIERWQFEVPIAVSR